jgi:hypothetical protein
MLKLGDPDSVFEVVDPDILAELLSLELVQYREGDGNLDFTDIGEEAYDELVGERAM